MSSSNLVAIKFIPETIYGETPGTGSFKTARFVSETLSGTAETTESQQIRTDRQSSGQIVTGLTVGGDLSFELAREAAIDDFFESAMFSVWSTLAIVNRDMTIDIDLKKVTAATGSFITDTLKVGDFVTLGGFATNNNQPVLVTTVAALEFGFSGPAGMTDEVGTSTSYKRADKLSIGTTKKSFSIQKEFTDLDEKAILYKGMLVSTMEISVNYGELINGSFGFAGNFYEAVEDDTDFITDGRTVTVPATTPTFNGTVDMPYLSSSATGALGEADFCIQSLGLNLNNNTTAQTCIGRVAPEDYSAGTAAIEISLSAYLKDSVWDLLDKKLNQASFALGFILRNTGGWYGFYLPAIQVSFEDPASAGANQDVVLDMSGTAKVGDNGESALTIYRSAA